MPKIKKINHVAIAVPDLDAALGFWRDTIGLEVDHVEDVASMKSKVAFLPVGESEVELVVPTSDDSGLAKFVQEKGGGMHHLCFEVEDLESVLAEFKTKGVRLINETPVVMPGRKMAFVHPKASSGVLVEFYEVTKE